MPKQSLASIAKGVRTAMKKHSPEILTGIGIAGMITTTVMAVKATPKALILLEEKKDQFDPRAFLPPIMDTVMYGNVPDEDVAALVAVIEKGVKEAIGTLIVQFGSFGKAPLVEQASLDEMAERYKKM